MKSHYKRIGKFAVVGVLNTLVDFAVFSLLFYVYGMYYVWAHVCAFLVANGNSFILNSLWTFKALRRDAFFRQIFVFFLISLGGLGVSTLVLYSLVGIFAIFLPSLWYPHLFGKVIASGASMVWNYIGSWLFVFKPTDQGEDGTPPP